MRVVITCKWTEKCANAVGHKLIFTHNSVGLNAPSRQGLAKLWRTHFLYGLFSHNLFAILERWFWYHLENEWHLQVGQQAMLHDNFLWAYKNPQELLERSDGMLENRLNIHCGLKLSFNQRATASLTSDYLVTRDKKKKSISASMLVKQC